MLSIIKLIVISLGSLFILTSSTAAGLFGGMTGGGSHSGGGHSVSSGSGGFSSGRSFRSGRSAVKFHGGHKRFGGGFNQKPIFHHPRKFHAIHAGFGTQLFPNKTQLGYGYPYKRKYYRNKIKYYYPYWYGFGSKSYLGQGYDDYQYDDFNPREYWAASNYGNIPFGAIIADYDGYGRPVYHCKAVYQQDTYYGRAVGDYCYINYYNRQVAVKRFEVRVNQ